MSSIIFQYDKRSGITYAYESTSYYDKEKSSLVQKESILDVSMKKTVRLFLPAERKAISILPLLEIL